MAANTALGGSYASAGIAIWTFSRRELVACLFSEVVKMGCPSWVRMFSIGSMEELSVNTAAAANELFTTDNLLAQKCNLILGRMR
jgi:hypothetical protein